MYTTYLRPEDDSRERSSVLECEMERDRCRASLDVTAHMERDSKRRCKVCKEGKNRPRTFVRKGIYRSHDRSKLFRPKNMTRKAMVLFGCCTPRRPSGIESLKELYRGQRPRLKPNCIKLHLPSVLGKCMQITSIRYCHDRSNRHSRWWCSVPHVVHDPKKKTCPKQ